MTVQPISFESNDSDSNDSNEFTEVNEHAQNDKDTKEYLNANNENLINNPTVTEQLSHSLQISRQMHRSPSMISMKSV